MARAATSDDHSFGYDNLNRLTSYSINAPGRRAARPPNSGAATMFLYDASGRLIASATTAGAISPEQPLIEAGLRRDEVEELTHTKGVRRVGRLNPHPPPILALKGP